MVDDLQSKPLLVVEDSDEDFVALERVLRRFCSVDAPLWRCLDGDDALDFLKCTGNYTGRESKLPSLILLDLNLPGTDGREVLTRIKQDDSLKMIPVIVLTTSSNEKDIEACYRAGVNSYMLKPMNMGQFKTSVQVFVDYWLKLAVLPNQL